MDMSTGSARDQFARTASLFKARWEVLDAPVFGSKQERTNAELWIMAAGKKEF